MILVTGGTGLVGAHLLLHLATRGQKVRALYRNLRTIEKTKNLFAHSRQHLLFDAIEWVQGDILDIPSLNEAFGGVTEVYHCAAMVSFDPKDAAMLRKVNIEGTANMVNSALHFGVKRFCHVSSIAALGDTRDNRAVTEETDWNPELYHSNYALSKYGAEMEAWRAWQEGLHVVIVNPGLIFGYGFWEQGTGRMLGAVVRGQYFYTKGCSGIVAVEDVVKPMVQLMERDVNGERFTLVAQNITYRELLNTIADSMDKKRPALYATEFLTSFAWRADWLLSRFFGRKRRFTRSMARSSHNREYYDNSKVTAALDYRFTDVNAYLMRLSQDYPARR